MGGWGWRAGNVEVVLERPVSGRQADRRNDRDWATAERRLSGAALKIANVATWWKAACPLSGSDARKRTFVQKVGQGGEGPFLVETGTTAFRRNQW